MALQFTTDIQTLDGFTVANAYGRVTAKDSYEGGFVSGHVMIFASEAAFLADARPVKTALIQDCGVAYDRTTDGVDILNIAHEGLIAELAKQGIAATKQL